MARRRDGEKGPSPWMLVAVMARRDPPELHIFQMCLIKISTNYPKEKCYPSVEIERNSNYWNDPNCWHEYCIYYKSSQVKQSRSKRTKLKQSRYWQAQKRMGGTDLSVVH